MGLIFISIFISFRLAWSQNAANRTVSPFALTKIGLEAWSKGGAYVASWRNPLAPIHNPASSIADGHSVYVEVGRAFPSEYLGSDFDNQFILPGYLAFSTTFKNLNLSVAYANSYNLKLEGGPNTPEPLPEGPGVMIGVKSETTVHTFLGSIGYRIPQRVAIGATVGINFLKENEEVKGTEFSARGDGLGPRFSIGFLYSPLHKITFGTSFHYSGDIAYDPEGSLPSVVSGDSSRGSRGTSPITQPDQLTVRFPWSVQFGVQYEAISFLNLYAMLDYQKWSSARASLHDELQFHLGAKFIPTSIFNLALGFFTLNDPITVLNLDQKFLTFGVQLQAYKNIGLYATILDSHLFADEPKQTYLGLGLQYSRN